MPLGNISPVRDTGCAMGKVGLDEVRAVPARGGIQRVFRRGRGYQAFAGSNETRQLRDV